jgi:NADPH2:quinone reductase
VQPGDFVLVPAAAGGTGGLICQMAAARGATVIGLTSSAEKTKIAQAHGAKYVINYHESPNFADEVLTLSGGRGVNVVYDGVG